MVSTVKVDTIDTPSGAGSITLNRPLITASGVGAGKVIQVIQTHVITASTQSITAGTRANISGLNATITPSATTSKILISVRWNGEGGSVNSNESVFGIKRDSTDVGLPASAGSRQVGIAIISLDGGGTDASSTPNSAFYEFLDSPSSTSAIVYHATILQNYSQTLYNNRTVTDTDSGPYERLTSTITLWEIGA